MTARIALTSDQIKWLDTAVYSAIARTPGRRSLGLEYDEYVAEVIKALPAGKEPFRYIDGSLQRLRRAGRLVFERRVEAPHWMVWRVVRGGGA